MRRLRIAPLGGLVLVALASLAAGCGSSGSKTSGSTTGAVTADPTIAAAVPAAIRSKGTLTIASDGAYPPNEFIGTDGKTVEGMDPDLAKALGEVMGLRVRVVVATFDGIIPGLAAGRYDLGMSSFTDNKEREKVVDFVTYFEAKTAFFVKVDGGPAINGLADLCGHTVTTQRGTTQAADANTQSAECKKAGKPGVTVRVFPDTNAANLALTSGRGDVGMADLPPAADFVNKSSGQFKLSGEPYGRSHTASRFPRGTAWRSRSSTR